VPYELIKFTEKCSKDKIINFEVVRRFNVEEKSYIDDISNNIAFFQPIAFTWKSVLDNFGEIKLSTDKFSLLFIGKTSASFDRAEYTDSVHHIYNKVVSFLSSSNLMLTFLENNATSKEQKNEWNEVRRELHKNNLCYRFSYELRNHSLHASLPITEVSVSNINSKQKPMTKIILNKNDLLESQKATKSLVKYINSFEGPQIDLCAVFDDYLKILANLYGLFIEQNESCYNAVCNFYTHYSKLIRDESIEFIGYVNSTVKDEDLLDQIVRLELGTTKWIIELNEKVSKLRRT